MSTLYLTLLFISGAVSAPGDEPVRVELPVYDQPQPSPDSILVQPLQPENHPEIKINKDKSIVDNLLSKKLSGFGSNSESSSPPVSILLFNNKEYPCLFFLMYNHKEILQDNSIFILIQLPWPYS